MNIHELEKQATPGPLIAQGLEDKRSTDATLTSFSPVFRNPRYVAKVYGQGVFSNLCEGRDANARLLVHCRNNFIRALEALKEEHGNHTEGGCGGTRFCGTCKLIEELEDVK